MAKSFAELKKSRKTSLNAMSDKLNKMSGGKKDYKDERIWTLPLDEKKSGEAIIRFLPEPEGEEDPIVRIFSHFFRGKGGWYIENSLTTFGESDPVAELNSELWNTGVESQKQVARNQKRQQKYYSNILVVKDPANPENEGKVFLYEYGPQIYKMIDEALHPKFETKKKINPFDMWEGSNLELRVYSKEVPIGGQNRMVPQYDDCSWSAPCPVDEDESVMEEIYGKAYSLQELLDKKNFKSYDELKARLDRVLGNWGNGASAPQSVEEAPTPKPEREAQEPKAAPAPWDDDDEDDDDDDGMEFLKKIAGS